MSAPQHWRKAIIQGVPCLVPSDDETEAWLKKRKAGEAVALCVDHVRNVARSALYWCVCGLVAENKEDLNDREAVSDVLKVMAGFYTAFQIKLADGSICWWRKPKSIAFANMKEDEFERYMERAFRLIETELLPGADIEELRKEAYVRSRGPA